MLREAAESGDIRMLFELTDFDGLEPAAWYDDVNNRGSDWGSALLRLEALGDRNQHGVGGEGI